MARDDRYIGQTYGPAGMGMNAYMDRPGPQRRSNVRDLGQTYGPAGMGMNAYMNRPEQQQRGIPPSKRFGQGIPSPGRRFENYLNRGMGRGIDSLGPNIGRDRHPTTVDPIMAMLNNPQVMLDFNYATDLENLQEDNIMNRLMIGEKFDPMIEAEELKRNPPYDGPSIMDILGGQEQAALDPSDYRTIIKILEAGGNPEDYMAANRGGIASLMR